MSHICLSIPSCLCPWFPGASPSTQSSGLKFCMSMVYQVPNWVFCVKGLRSSGWFRLQTMFLSYIISKSPCPPADYLGSNIKKMKSVGPQGWLLWGIEERNDHFLLNSATLETIGVAKTDKVLGLSPGLQILSPSHRTEFQEYRNSEVKHSLCWSF